MIGHKITQKTHKTNLAQISQKNMVEPILRSIGLKFAKPYPKDYRRPPDAEEQLKKLEESLSINTDIIGFFDEFSPQNFFFLFHYSLFSLLSN